MSLTTDTQLQEIRERRDLAEHEWSAIREEAKKDRLCVAGKTWDALDRRGKEDREAKFRPFLNLDELGQYVNQTVNDIRANPRGIQFSPIGNGANDATAEFYENYMRDCEYRSHAHIIYSNAFEQAVIGGMGWLRVNYKRQHARSFEADLVIEPIVNADQVLPDPSMIWPNGRDMRFLFYVEPWSKREFALRFPKAKIKDFAGLSTTASPWVQDDQVQVAEYWTVDTVTRRLVAMRHPSGEVEHVFADELENEQLPAGVENLREEEIDDATVTMRLTNGVEILSETAWPGRYIPFVSCMGKPIYIDEGLGAKRVILSLVRLARDPQMLYNYIRTCEAESVGGMARATWVGYTGQFHDPERWQKANHEPVAFLEADATVEGVAGTILPLPQKQSWDPPLGNLEEAAEAARRAIQSAMGISPLPTPLPTQDRQLSGKAMDRLDSSGQKGSFHLKDHYKLMLERVGEIYEDLLPHVLDADGRKVAVRKPDDSSEMVVINDPHAEKPIFTDTDHRVTVSEGPATESQRVEATDFVNTLVGNLSEIAQLAGAPPALQLLAKSIKLKQLGPIGDEIISLLAPPTPNGQNGKPLSPDAQMLYRQVQMLQQQLGQAKQLIESKQAEQQAQAQTQMQLEGMKADKAAQLQITLKQMDVAAKIEVARITAAQQAADADAEAEEERIALGIKLAHEQREAAKDRIHERLTVTGDQLHQQAEQTRQRVHERLQAELQHQQTLQQVDQQHANVRPVERAGDEQP